MEGEGVMGEAVKGESVKGELEGVEEWEGAELKLRIGR